MRHRRLPFAALLWLGVTAAAFGQQKPAQAKPAQAAKPTGQTKPAPQTGSQQAASVDKAALEQYVRHLFVWGPQIEVKVHDPKPSAELPGFSEVTVSARAGQASQEAAAQAVVALEMPNLGLHGAPSLAAPLPGASKMPRAGACHRAHLLLCRAHVGAHLCC